MGYINLLLFGLVYIGLAIAGIADHPPKAADNQVDFCGIVDIQKRGQTTNGLTGRCMVRCEGFVSLPAPQNDKLCSVNKNYKKCCGILESGFGVDREPRSTKKSYDGLTPSEVSAVCHEPDESTRNFMFQQTMLRIKDPKRSLEFYTKVLGMRLLKQLDYPSMKMSLYFVGYERKEDIPLFEDERMVWALSRKATLELTHIWGTESQPEFKYHNGNTDPKGFGHIGILVPDVEKACDRFEQLGVEFVKKPDEGKMKGLAFIKDPDGYWIEILNPRELSLTS